MQSLLTAHDVGQIDERILQNLGIAEWQLMDVVCEAALPVIQAIIGTQPSPILVVCGRGNNGGDGLGLAWRLHDAGHDVQAWVDMSRVSETCTPQFKHCVSRGITKDYTSISDDGFRPHYILDALTGVGFHDQLSEEMSGLVQRLKAFNATMIAIDVPTGLNATTGVADRSCIVADHTITMMAPKLGMIRGDGLLTCGNVHIVRLPRFKRIVEEVSKYREHTHDDIRAILPRRQKNTSKFDFGRVVVLGGSIEMPGAPSLTSEAALRTGAGLVHLCAPSIHPGTPREVIVHAFPTEKNNEYFSKNFDTIHELIANAGVLAVGPGLGANTVMQEAVSRLIASRPQGMPCVIDADGLRLIGKSDFGSGPVIITPHVGEFARLLGIDRNHTHGEWCEIAYNYANATGCIVHLKGTPSITTNGTNFMLTSKGNPGMATAGSGDVLTGVIAGLLGQNLNAYQAASLGAYMHASAGDIAAAAHSQEWMMASDIIASMSDVFKHS